FGINTAPDEWPKLKPAYRDQIKSLYLGPTHPGTDAPMLSGADEIVNTPLGEETALNQAAAVKATGAVSRESVVELMRLIVGEFTSLKALAKKWAMEYRLDAAQKRVDERSKRLAAHAAPDHLEHWAAQTETQLAVLGTVRQAVAHATETEKQFAGFG